MTKHAKAILAAGFAVALALPVAVQGSRFQKTEDTNPLRIVGYVGHALGTGVEWLVFRPLHWVVSQPNLDIVFGHAARVNDEPGHWEWKHGDYRPSIAAERAAKSGSSSAPAARRAERPAPARRSDVAEQAPASR